MSRLSSAMNDLAAALAACTPYAHVNEEPFFLGYRRDADSRSLSEHGCAADWRRFSLRCEQVRALEIGGLGRPRYEASLLLETHYPDTLDDTLGHAYFGAECELLSELIDRLCRDPEAALLFGELLESDRQAVPGGLRFVHHLLIHYDHSDNGARDD